MQRGNAQEFNRRKQTTNAPVRRGRLVLNLRVPRYALAPPQAEIFIFHAYFSPMTMLHVGPMCSFFTAGIIPPLA